MNKKRNVIEKYIEVINHVSGNNIFSLNSIVTILLGTLLALIILQVFLRFIFNNPIYWIEELVKVIIVWVNSIAIPIVYKEKGHPAIMFFLTKMSPKIREILNIFINIFICFLAITIGIASMELFKIQAKYSPIGGMPFSRAYYYALPTFVFSLLLLFFSIYFIFTSIIQIQNRGENY